MATALKTPQLTPDNATIARNRKIRSMIQTKNPNKIDILPVGANRYRVNVWAETGDRTDGGFFNEKRIVETFYHVEGR